ncbi:uncharacterized protein LOC122091335 [Macadamia integrifolia]|uniref:uncharacterized protein LOC122091335 n=1 Tax=Macadamia integrifolia TaxID=60698 RepID=UPI001C4FBD3A|nr:uncharacterized protein LOC122091335 [Macadamia integrifolia]
MEEYLAKACWEGSANDCRVFNRALKDPTLRFSHPPQGISMTKLSSDALFQQFGEDDYYDPNEERVRVVNVHGVQEDGDVAGTSTTIHQGSQRVQGRQMNELRIQIANQMVVDKGYPLI